MPSTNGQIVNVYADYGATPSSAPGTAASVSACTAALQAAFTNNLGRTIYLPCFGNATTYWVNDTIYMQFHHVICDPGVTIAAHNFVTNREIVKVGSSTIDDLTVQGNSSNPGQRNGSPLVTDTNTLGWVARYNRLTLYDFTNNAIECLGESVFNDPIIFGKGAGSINPTTHDAVNSYYGIWSNSSTAKITVRGGLFRDIGWAAIYGCGECHIDGVRFKNNHRQYGSTGGGNVAMAENGVRMTVTNCIFSQDVGLATGASGVEMQMVPWTVTNNQFYNLSRTAIVKQYNDQKHIIIGNRGTGNTNGIEKTYIGTDSSIMVGNTFS